MSVNPKVLDEKTVYQNRWIQVYEKKISFGDDSKALDYYVIGKRMQIAAILAVDEDDNVMLTQQYRFAVDDSPLDIPGGGVMPDEDPIDAAKRELKEETGFSSDSLELLTARYLDSGQKDCIQYIYLAKGLKAGDQQLDDTEDIQLIKKNIYELRDEILAGEHRESTLMIAILLYLTKERTNENIDRH